MVNPSHGPLATGYKRWQESKWASYTVACLLIVAGISVIWWLSWQNAVPLADEQLHSNTSSGELWGEMRVGQTFTALYPGLYRIDVLVATFERENSGEVYLHVATEPKANTDLAVAAVNARKMRNGQFQSFPFAPIRTKPGETYCFYLTAPQSAPGNAITVLRHTENQYPGGSAFATGEKEIVGDLAFVIYYRPSPLDLANAILSKITDHRPGLLGHRGFLIGLGVPYLLLVSALLVRCRGLINSLRPPVSETKLTPIRARRWLAVIFVSGLLIRLILAYFSSGAPHDMVSYRMQGEAVLNGQNIYTATAGRHPYPPLWMFVPAGALILESRVGLPFTFWVRLPIIAFDLGIGALLWFLLKRKDEPTTALRNVALYIFNPITLLIVSHGMFDAIPLFFILLAYLWLVQSQAPGRNILSAVAIGLGIAIKGFPVLVLPAFVLKQAGWRRRIVYGIVAFLPLALLLPFIFTSGHGAVERVFARVGVSDHGYGLLLQTLANQGHPRLQHWLAVFRARGSLLVLAGVLIGMWAARRKSLAELIVLGFGLCYVLSVGIASQYLLWILPFLILGNDKRAAVYSGFSTLILLIYYATFGPGVLGQGKAIDLIEINPIRMIAEAAWWLACVELVWAVFRGRASA